MPTFLKAVVTAATVAFGASAVLAQTTTQPQPKPPAQTSPSDTNASPGSRGMTGNDPSPDKANKKDGAPDIKKLDEQGRGGQKN